MTRCSTGRGWWAFVLLGGPALVAAGGPVDPPGAAADPPAVDESAGVTGAARYREHVGALTDPALEGRLAGTPGSEAAAAYLERALADLGLGPFFDAVAEAAEGAENGGAEVRRQRASYRQVVELEAPPTLGEQVMTLHLPDGDVALDPVVDFRVMPCAGSARLERAPVVFVGYSIPAGPGGYLGYAPGADLTGKVAIALRYEPFDELGRSLWSDQQWTFNTRVAGKVLAAARRNAAAVVLVSPPGVDAETPDDLEAFATLEMDEPLCEAPAVALSDGPARRLLEAGDPERRSLEELRDAAARQGVVVELEGVSVSLTAETLRRPRVTHNIGAVLPGRGDLAGEWVVLVAGYDGLGRGLTGSRRPELAGQVHPGADDNASGVAGVLHAAARLASEYDGLGPRDDARSVAFVLLGGKEEGKAGAKAYLKEPPVPLGKHSLVINLDMIGSLADDGLLEIAGIDSARGLENLVAPAVARAGVPLAGELSYEQERADWAEFIRRGVPALVFFTGLHDRYRTPEDTAESLDAAGAVRVAELAADVALAAAMSGAPLRFDGPAPPAPPSIGGVDAVKVRTGLAPASEDGRGEGMRISRVASDTSAARAGLRAGDRVVKWDGEAVKGVSDWSALLPRHEPGDRVEVVVLRAGEEVKLTVVLEGREKAKEK